MKMNANLSHLLTDCPLKNDIGYTIIVVLFDSNKTNLFNCN